MTRFLIQFSGYHENGRKTDIQYEILNMEGEVNMDTIKKELVKAGGLSPFRSKKEIDIYHIQVF